MARITTQTMIDVCNRNGSFSLDHSGNSRITKESPDTYRAPIEYWHYAVAVDTHRLIGELVKEQRATRKVMERIDRRLAKRVKL